MSLVEITAVKGADVRQPIVLWDDQGRAVTTFTSSATLSLAVWAGDDLPAVTTGSPSAEWIDAAAGTVRLIFPAAFTDALSVGAIYTVNLTITVGTIDPLVYTRPVAKLYILPEPGVATVGATYCTYDDCLTYASWLPRMQADSAMLQTTLTEQRVLARRWLDNAIIERARRDVSEQYRRHAPVSATEGPTISSGVDAGYDWGPSIYPEPSIQTQVEAIRTALANNYLMTTDGMARKITAHYAIYLACDGQLPGGDTPDYQEFGRRHLGYATIALAGYTARIDTDADGTADYEITP